MSARTMTSLTTFRFDQLATLINDRVDNPAESGVERYVGLEHLDADSLRIRRWGEVTDVESTKLRFRPGDIIFGKRRVYQRKLAVADFTGICSAHAMVLRAKANVVLPEFLPFFMRSDHFMERALEISVGSLSPTINWKTLAAEEFALPPIEEQVRITAMLQSLEHCISAALAARNSADSMLRSLLLTKIPAVSVGHERLRVARFGDHVEIIDPNPSHRYPDYDDNGVPLVATQDFSGRDDYVLEKCKRVPRGVFERQRARCRFQPEDVVFARKGVLGSARRYGLEEKTFSHTIVIMKPRGDSMASDFLLWLARSDSFMNQIQRAMNRNSGVPTLGVKTLEDLEVPLPPKDEQRSIALQAKEIDEAVKQWEDRRDRYLTLLRRALALSSTGGQAA